LLVKGQNLDKLIHLNVRGCSLGDKGVADLLKSTTVLNLRHLILDENNLTDDAANNIATSPLFELQTLSLGWNSLKEFAAVAIASSEALRSLQTLTLNNNSIKDEGIGAIAGSDNLKGLRHLNVCNNHLGEIGCQILATTETLHNLHYLNIENNAIGETGCKVLAECNAFQLLTTLVIYSGNNVTQEAKKCLLRGKKLKNLNSIS
jgi:Leucine-rich repeat (LRR) protein